MGIVPGEFVVDEVLTWTDDSNRQLKDDPNVYPIGNPDAILAVWSRVAYQSQDGYKRGFCCM